MALTYYMDVHIPSAVTEGLRRREIDVITSQEDGTREFDDEPLLRRACELGRILVSQDTDLLQVVHDWQEKLQSFPGLIFSHQENASIGRLISDLELIAQCCPPEEVRGQVYYLPLK
jgi:predicted nuclease of predicted toxin-antitoxin system